MFRNSVFKPLLWTFWLYIFTKFQKQVRGKSMKFHNWVCLNKSDVWSLYSHLISEGIKFQNNQQFASKFQIWSILFQYNIWFGLQYYCIHCLGASIPVMSASPGVITTSEMAWLMRSLICWKTCDWCLEYSGHHVFPQKSPKYLMSLVESVEDHLCWSCALWCKSMVS